MGAPDASNRLSDLGSPSTFLRRFLIELGASTWPSWTMRIAERTASSEEAWYELKGIDDDERMRGAAASRLEPRRTRRHGWRGLEPEQLLS